MMKNSEKTSQNYLIIGGGIAGVSAAEAIRKADGEGKITLICNEPELPYFRMNLTRYLAGEYEEEKLPLHPKSWYETNKVELLLETTVDKIDLDEKTVHLEGDGSLSYDKLVLANGAQPFVPPFPGRDLDGVWTVRTHEDADEILDCCQGEVEVVCIGGGLLGLENAGALAKQGASVTVIETFDWLLPRQLPKEGGKQLEKLIHKLGIKVITGGKVKAIKGEGKVSAVSFEDGSEIPADLVLITTGVKADVDLAKEAGLAVNKGVLVDEQMRTSAPDIFAAGDISECNGRLYGLWVPAKAQGAVAGKNAAGGNEVFPEMPPSAKLKVLGVDLFSVGQVSPAADDEHLVFDAQGEDFAGFVLKAGKLIGASLLGDTALAQAAKEAVNEQRLIAKEGWEKMSLEDLKKALNA